MAIITTYPFDVTGELKSNLILNERHPLTTANSKDFFFIVPKYAPFYQRNLSISYQAPSANPVPFTLGKDYFLSHKFLEASLSLSEPVWGSITLLQRDLNGTLIINYQTLGGEWNIDAGEVIKILADTKTNPRTVSWEQVVNLPHAFPPVKHSLSVHDIYNMDELGNNLKVFISKILGAGTSTVAVNNTLSKVLNLGIYPALDAVNLTDDWYMTPRGTKFIVDYYNDLLEKSMVQKYHLDNLTASIGALSSVDGAKLKDKIDDVSNEFLHFRTNTTLTLATLDEEEKKDKRNLIVLDGRVDNITSLIGNQNQTIQDTNTAITTLKVNTQNTLDEFSKRIESIKKTAAIIPPSVKSVLDDLSKKYDALKLALTSGVKDVDLTQKVVELTKELEALKPLLTTTVSKEDFAQLQVKVETIVTGEINGSLVGRVNGLETRYTDLNNRVVENTSKISTLESKNDVLTTEIANHKAKLTLLESSSSTTASYEAKFTGLGEKLKSLTEKVTSLSDEVTKVKLLGTKLNDLESSISALNIKVSLVDNLQSQLDSLSKSVDALNDVLTRNNLH